MKCVAKALLCAGVVCIFDSTVHAEPWKVDLNTSLTGTINSYSDNWSGGEAGSFTWTAQLLESAERQLAPILNTKTTLKLDIAEDARLKETFSAGLSYIFSGELGN